MAHSSFHLEIDGLDAFEAFVAILRGDDSAKVADLIAKITVNNDALDAATKAAQVSIQS